MYIGLVEECADYGLANMFFIVQRIMTLLQIIVPILAIIALVKILLKLMADPENKKLKGSIKNWLLALIIFFMLPFIINAVMGLLDQNYSVSTCWNYARTHKTINDSNGYQNSSYKNNDDGKKTHLID